MSGADLANVCNEGALMAARQGQKSITFDNFNKEREIRYTLSTGIFYSYRCRISYYAKIMFLN